MSVNQLALKELRDIKVGMLNITDSLKNLRNA